MFTGIVRELGCIASVGPSDAGLRLEVDAPTTAVASAVGDSVALNGCCLTAVTVETGRLGFEAVAETLSRTTVGSLVAGSRVNLEPALRAGEPLGGHFVQGHVDAVATVRRIEDGGQGLRLVVEAPATLLRFVVEKGSVTLDGVSLTVAGVDEATFSVALIPHTLAVTTLGGLTVGSRLNLEVDVLAKYVERLLLPG